MLVHLAVRNLAIVDNVELELGAGMTVLTGETGAGKSLIVDALELVVGGRASAAMVRAGASSAEVHALFNASQSVLSWLREQSLDDDEPICVLRRTVGVDGRSRAFINSRPVAIAQLRDLGEQLVDVHGQHAHQALLKTQAQRDLIDEHGQHTALLTEVASSCEELRRIDTQISALSLDDENPAARMDFLQFQIDELRAQPLGQNTLEALNGEHKKLANAAEILSAITAIQRVMDGDDGAQEKIAGASRSLDSLLRLDDTLNEPLERLRDGATAIAEAQSALQRYAETLQADSHRLAQLERMLGVIHDLARKHRCSDSQLQARLQALESERDRISGAEAALCEALAEHERLLTRYRKQAKQLSNKRKDCGARMAKAATAVVATLGMEDARITFSIEHVATAR
ncbi:MAG: DNA repair protein RecN (Recombination protein N), partial [Gammaproteobacteria bacterium]